MTMTSELTQENEDQDEDSDGEECMKRKRGNHLEQLKQGGALLIEKQTRKYLVKHGKANLLDFQDK